MDDSFGVATGRDVGGGGGGLAATGMGGGMTKTLPGLFNGDGGVVDVCSGFGATKALCTSRRGAGRGLTTSAETDAALSVGDPFRFLSKLRLLGTG